MTERLRALLEQALEFVPIPDKPYGEPSRQDQHRRRIEWERQVRLRLAAAPGTAESGLTAQEQAVVDELDSGLDSGWSAADEDRYTEAKARHRQMVRALRTPTTDAIDTIAFLRSVALSGERLDQGDEDRINATIAALRAAAPSTPDGGLDVDERKGLEAMVNYWIGRGDTDGALSHEEGWAIARSVVDGLASGEVRHTSSIPKPGFTVEVRVHRLAAAHPQDPPETRNG